MIFYDETKKRWKNFKIIFTGLLIYVITTVFLIFTLVIYSNPPW